MHMQKYYVIGLMSGTSLDGVDLAYTEFIYDTNKWNFNLIHYQSIPYDTAWRNKLNDAMKLDALGIQYLDIELAEYFSLLINHFIKENKITNIDFISSHGHTVFHQPEKKLSLQIGAGNIIASNCGIDVVCDFRKQDVAIGGQGAPLVPIGDRYLFSEYDFCLNIGGIANVSFEIENQRIAYDICPANMVLNYYAELKNKNYDEEGNLASQGKLNTELLNQLNYLDYYSLPIPKSLGKEYVFDNVIPLINSFDISIEDKLHTFCTHIAMQIASAVPVTSATPSNQSLVTSHQSPITILATGGGAYNTFLINKIKEFTEANIVIPSKEMIEFKEAIVFAFLGVLYKRSENNCLASVTGARKDHCSGVYYRA